MLTGRSHYFTSKVQPILEDLLSRHQYQYFSNIRYPYLQNICDWKESVRLSSILKNYETYNRSERRQEVSEKHSKYLITCIKKQV